MTLEAFALGLFVFLTVVGIGLGFYIFLGPGLDKLERLIGDKD